MSSCHLTETKIIVRDGMMQKMTFKDAQWHTIVMSDLGSLRQKDSKHKTRKTVSQKTANRNADNVKGVAFKYTMESND